MKQKGLPRLSNIRGFAHIFLLIAIVLVGIVGVGYVAYQNGQIKTPSQISDSASPTPTISEVDTSDWKTYRNEEYGFEIKFPPDWSFVERKDTSNLSYKDILQFVPVPEGQPWGDNFYGTFAIYKDVNNFNKWFDTTVKFDANQGMTDTYKQLYESDLNIEDFKFSYENILVDNEPAIVQVVEQPRCQQELIDQCFFFGLPQGYIKQWHIYKQNNVYAINIQTTTGPVEGIDQILSTFKFIDKKDFSIISEAVSPNLDHKIVIQGRWEDNILKQQFVQINNSSGEKVVLLEKIGVDSATWEDLSKKNWSPNSEYFFLHTHIPDSGELHIFKANGQKFSSGDFLLLSKLGYNNNSIGDVKWISENQLIFSTGNLLGKGPDYMIDVNDELINIVKR